MKTLNLENITVTDLEVILNTLCVHCSVAENRYLALQSLYDMLKKQIPNMIENGEVKSQLEAKRTIQMVLRLINAPVEGGEKNGV